MERPFLVDGFDSPDARWSGIADEAQWYIQAQSGMELPPDVPRPTEMPDCLYWLLMTERWGLPYAGGYLQQPWHFMKDIEAAALGRMRVEEIREANTRVKQQRGNDAWPQSQSPTI